MSIKNGPGHGPKTKFVSVSVEQKSGRSGKKNKKKKKGKCDLLLSYYLLILKTFENCTYP